MGKTKQLNVPLPESLMKQLKKEADKRGMKLYSLVEEIVAAFLRRAFERRSPNEQT